MIHIITVCETQRMDRKFTGMIFFLIKRVFHFSGIFPAVISESVGHIASAEPMFAQIRRCHASCSQSQSFKRIVARKSVDRTDIKFTVFTGLNIAGKQYP